uniref:Uncharacterized protein n=1 Tax=Helianthus annuus TaxID=4232 RepID=A0A251VRA9_HELAN
MVGRRGDSSSDVSSEHSENAAEDILIFFYQLDLATPVQVFTCFFHCIWGRIWFETCRILWWRCKVLKEL